MLFRYYFGTGHIDIQFLVTSACICLVDKISSKGLGLFHNPKKGMPLDAITLLASEYLLNSLINPVK